MDRHTELWTGVKESLPIVLGYLPLGFAFGVLASKDAGMTVAEAAVMSVMVFTGAGQYIAVGMLKDGAPYIAIILTNLLVNLRYFLFATSLVPYLKLLPTRIATLLSYGLTDETYAVSVAHYAKHPPTTYYLAGLNLTSHLSWIASSALGAYLGGLVADTSKFGLDFALPAMYAILLVLVVSRRRDVLVAATAAVVCLGVGYLVPSTMVNMANIMVATLVGASIGVVFKR